MSFSQRLRSLQQVREFNEGRQAGVLSKAFVRKQERQHKLEELRSYLGEYESRQSEIHDPLLLANHAAFLNRIRSAIQSQGQAVNEAGRQLAQERARLLLARRDRSVLDQLAAHYAKQDARREQAELQDQQDECAQRRRPPTVMAGI